MFLLIIFTLELAVGIAGFVRRNEVENMLEINFSESLTKYKTQPEIQTSWNTVQNDVSFSLNFIELFFYWCLLNVHI